MTDEVNKVDPETTLATELVTAKFRARLLAAGAHFARDVAEAKGIDEWFACDCRLRSELQFAWVEALESTSSPDPCAGPCAQKAATQTILQQTCDQLESMNCECVGTPPYQCISLCGYKTALEALRADICATIEALNCTC